VKLFHSIKPLFANKPIMLVINKIDQVKPEDLPEEQRQMIQEIVEQDAATVVTMSCYLDEGVMQVRNASCDKLLAARVEMKMKGQKINDVINKIHLAEPVARDNVVRAPQIPAAAVNRPKFDIKDPNRRRLERDIEAENGGAGVFSADYKSKLSYSNGFNCYTSCTYSILQSDMTLPTPTGNMTLFLNSGKVTMLPTSLILISKRSLKLSSVKKSVWRRKDSMIPPKKL
jgi:hypothetical protein